LDLRTCQELNLLVENASNGTGDPTISTDCVSNGRLMYHKSPNTMKNAFILIAALFLIASCHDRELEQKNDTINYFESHLKTDMNYENLERTFGQPDDDIGSGIHIYVYNLEDGTKVLVGFVDKILYASHVDENRKLIKTLI
jgi:hypothetical protein